MIRRSKAVHWFEDNGRLERYSLEMMMNVTTRIFTILICVLGLQACQTASERSVSYPITEDLPPPSTAPVEQAGASAITGVVVTREWEDVQKIDGERRYMKVQIGYDYDQRKAFWKEFSLDGELTKEEYADWMPIGVSSEETEHSFDIALAHPVVSEAVAEYDINMHGGFQFMEQDDPDCGLVSRCVHVFAFDKATEGVVAHSIVDLLTNRVVHPVYDFNPKTWVAQKGENS